MRFRPFVVLALCLAALGARGQGRVELRLDDGPVVVVRDAYGVPHVYAETLRGLYFGAGYAAAVDRIGQMELSRRVARGEMAALVGQSAVASDRETRLDGYTEEERERQYARLGENLRLALAAYAEGVNRHLEELRAGAAQPKIANFPVPFDAAKLRPWRVTDSIAIIQMMSRRFGGMEGGELRNQLLFGFLKGLHKEKAYAFFNDLAWRNDPRSPTTLPPGEDGRGWPGLPHWAGPDGKLLTATARPAAAPPARRAAGSPKAASRAPRLVPTDPDLLLAAARTLDQAERLALAERLGLFTRWGSYCYAVSAQKSATGYAMLVGGPQMGFRTPSIAHEVRLLGAGIDVVGMAFPGLPGVLIGHNAHLAWSTTTGVNDQTDIFVETLDPNDHTRYRFKGEWRSFERRVERIEVAGGETVEMEVLRSVHGPVVQVDKANHRAYSRMSTYWGRELENMEGFFGFHTARNVREFARACAKIVTSHNFFAADQEGNIGFWFCGRSPIRDPRVDPRFPTPGEGDHEWRGMVPFERMPQIINPKQGFLANWNNKPAIWWDNQDTPVWGEIWHSERISQLLAAKKKITPEEMRRILLDIGTNDYTAQVLLPLVNNALNRQRALLTPLARQAAGLLASWDHHGTEGSPSAVVFSYWLQQIRDDLFGKPFGFIKLQGGGLFNTAMQPSLILHVLLGPRSPVPVQADYLGGKSPDVAIAEAMNRAMEKAAKERGQEIALWSHNQGRINLAPLPPILSTDRGTYIQIVQCARPRVRGVSILPPGQSERTDSPHFGDQRELAGWFLFKPMVTERLDQEKR